MEQEQRKEYRELTDEEFAEFFLPKIRKCMFLDENYKDVVEPDLIKLKLEADYQGLAIIYEAMEYEYYENEPENHKDFLKKYPSKEAYLKSLEAEPFASNDLNGELAEISFDFDAEDCTVSIYSYRCHFKRLSNALDNLVKVKYDAKPFFRKDTLKKWFENEAVVKQD